MAQAKKTVLQSKNWCFTAWPGKLPEPAEKVVGVEFTYIGWGNEVCPETKKEHYQGFFQLGRKQTFKKLKTFLPSWHIEVMKGTVDEAVDYCKKEGDFQSFGALAVQGKRTDLDAVYASLDAGASELEAWQKHSKTFTSNYKAFERYMQLSAKRREWPMKVLCLHGLSGSGKTRHAVELASMYKSYCFAEVAVNSGFLMGYEGEECVIIDDYEGSMMSRNMFLRLTDRHPWKANVKNGAVEFVARCVIFTSNTSPDFWYDGDAATMRRITETIKIDEKWAEERAKRAAKLAEEAAALLLQKACFICGVIHDPDVDCPESMPPPSKKAKRAESDANVHDAACTCDVCEV